MGKTFRRGERRESSFRKKEQRMNDVRNWLGSHGDDELWNDYLERCDKKAMTHHPFSENNRDDYFDSREYKLKRKNFEDL